MAGIRTKGLLLGAVLVAAGAAPAAARPAAEHTTAWTVQQAPLISGQPPILYSAAAASPRVVWAAGSRGPANVALTSEVVKTLDGGRTWFVQYRPTDCCEVRDIVAASAVDLWLVRGSSGNNSSQILVSRDGGDTWFGQMTNSDAVWSIAAGSTSNAWASGSAGVMFYTADGQSWSRAPTPTVASLWETTAGSAEVGWAVGDDGTVLKTADGGRTWRAQPSGTFATLLGVHAASPDVVWAVGRGGVIIKSTDGGTTWGAQVSGVSADLSDIVAVSASHAWALATREDGPAVILGTTDGGATWHVEYQATRTEPRLVGGLAASGPYAAWAVGGGTILATTTAVTADRTALPLVARGPVD
jgi:photosystem II stability/assembly factor-like uncharacterized protein